MRYLVAFTAFFCLAANSLIACGCGDDDDDASGPGAVADDDTNTSDDDTVADDDAVDDDFDDDGFSDDDVFDDDVGDDDQEDDDGDDDADDDTAPSPLVLDDVDPSSGGASVDTAVTLYGGGFGAGLGIFVGDAPALSVEVISSTEAMAVFPAVPLAERGLRDVRVALGDEEATLAGAFEYLFDEDPIVFVHGLGGEANDFNTMKNRFINLGYPEEFLRAISFSDADQSSIDSAQELPAFVDAVLADTGTGKVDMVAHSMGAWAGRWYIKFLGGETKIRDYVSLAGTNHGNNAACLFAPFSESSAELCPAYAGDGDSENNIQFLLNGEPSVEDVDETPFGIEDGGEIAWHAMWAGLDEVVYPNTSACLNQTSRNDCSDPINKIAAWTFHLQMIQSQAVFDQVEIWLRERNISRP